MKIFVVPRNWILDQNKNFFINNNVINVYSSCYEYPLPESSSLLRLKFDDVTDSEQNPKYVKFSEKHAQKIFDFITNMNKSKDLYVNCDAGISRSGAIGMCLNDYFNRYLENNREDYEFFIQENSQIMPNPLVKRILMKYLFNDNRIKDSKRCSKDLLNNFKSIFI